MKKRILSAIVCIAVILFALPFVSGCKASLDYVLYEENGVGHYVAKCSGHASGLKGELVIAEDIDGVPVTEIAELGFANAAITKLVIPASIEKIGNAAFAYCNSLREVEVKAGGLTELPQAIFAYCPNLRSVSLADNIETIGVWAFRECGKLEDINMPTSLKLIEYQAFTECEYLSDVVLPETLERLGAMAFYSTNIEEIIIPANVRDTQIRKVDEDGYEYFERLEGIGYGAFHNCTRLKTAVVNASVTVIGSSVFGNCTALESVYLPATLESVEGAYYSDGIFLYGHAFHNCKSLKNVYYAGTREEWNAVKVTVGVSDDDDRTLTYNNADYDNRALVNANLHVESVYAG